MVGQFYHNNWTGSLANLLCLVQNLPQNLSPAGEDDVSRLDVSQLFQDRSRDQIVIELKVKTDVAATCIPRSYQESVVLLQS